MSLTFETYSHTFSANEIRQYSDCARKRYYSSRDNLALRAAKSSNSLVLGKAIHSWMEQRYLGNEPEVDTTILSIDDAKIFECVTRNYDEQIVEDLNKYKVIECEHEFRMVGWPIDNVMYHGQIDMIVLQEDTNTIYFFEHKTCKNFRPEIYNRFDIQLHIYAVYGERYCAEKGYTWGGMILNEIKKAKTDLGFAIHRMYYKYDDSELTEFTVWLAKKTSAAISPSNHHEPCNNYMTCSLCEYAPICLQFGYEVPKSSEEITQTFINSEDEPMYIYDPREEDRDE